MKKVLPFIDDIFYGLGAALIVAGTYLVYPVAALFVAGAFCLHFSYLLGKARISK